MKNLGLFFVFVGILLMLVSTSFTITGNAVKEGINLGSSFIGFVFLVGGLALFLASKEGNLAKKVLESGAVITNSKKLKKIARKMGYEGREVKEGYQVLDYKDKPLTVIPNHKDVSKRVYYSVMKALSTGESNFGSYRGLR